MISLVSLLADILSSRWRDRIQLPSQVRPRLLQLSTKIFDLLRVHEFLVCRRLVPGGKFHGHFIYLCITVDSANLRHSVHSRRSVSFGPSVTLSTPASWPGLTPPSATRTNLRTPRHMRPESSPGHDGVGEPILSAPGIGTHDPVASPASHRAAAQLHRSQDSLRWSRKVPPIYSVLKMRRRCNSGTTV